MRPGGHCPARAPGAANYRLTVNFDGQAPRLAGVGRVSVIQSTGPGLLESRRYQVNPRVDLLLDRWNPGFTALRRPLRGVTPAPGHYQQRPPLSPASGPRVSL